MSIFEFREIIEHINLIHLLLETRGIDTNHTLFSFLTKSPQVGCQNLFYLHQIKLEL